MGCTNSKEEPRPPEDDATQAQSPERDETTRAAPEPEQHVKDPAEGPAVKGSKFVQGGPAIEGGLVTPCFKSGMLFKIVKDDSIYFYNDSADHEAEVIYTTPNDSCVAPGPSTSEAAAGDNHKKFQLVVYPGETEEFSAGVFNGYRSEYFVRPLSVAYVKRIQEESDRVVKAAMADVASLGGETQEDVIKLCVEKGVSFVDTEFPPSKESLCKASDPRQLNPLLWKRPSAYLPEGSAPGLYKDGVSPDDIDQGQLGDCWFLCAVASVAEPQGDSMPKIVDMFSHPSSSDMGEKERSVGLYRVTLNKNGWWRCVIVDDFLPCIVNKPCFAKNNHDLSELWVAVLEKAYAKINGSYASITGGDALHAMSDLTGYPTSRFDTEWEDALASEEGSTVLFNDILRYDQEGYLINLNTPGVDSTAYLGPNASQRPANDQALEQRYAEAGLGLGHAYSVLVAKQFELDGETVRLLQIRNPWGTGQEWSGAWCDTSELWDKYPHVREECGQPEGACEDGTFWMEWADVKKYFDGGGVCFTKYDWHDFRVPGAFTEGYTDIVLEIFAHEDFDAFVVLSQPDRRGEPRESPNAKYSPLMLTVCRPDDANPSRVVVDANSTADADKPELPFKYIIGRDVSVKYSFKRSDRPYLVIPRIYDKGIAKKSFVLGLVSSVATGAGMSVNFKSLDRGAVALKHCKAFAYLPDQVSAATEREFQYNPEEGFPLTLRGTSLSMS